MVFINRFSKLLTDFGLNIIASVITIGTMQLLVYPTIGQKSTPEYYGLFLTIIGIINTITSTFGNSLNNLRLLTNQEYFQNKYVGDFNILLIIGVLFSVVCCVILTIYSELSSIDALALLCFSVFAVLRSYLNVEFRLKINYKKVVIMNCIMSCGYILACLWYRYFNEHNNNWIFVFLFSEFITFIYLCKATSLLKERIAKTALFNITTIKYCNLIYTSFVASVMMYFDRNLLYPFIGGSAVAVYFAATVVGKSIGIIIGPMSSVLLSYYSQVDFEMTRKKFWQINKAICISAMVSYFLSIIIVDYVVGFLYPHLYYAAKPLFLLANMVPLLDIIASMSRPAALKYTPLHLISLYQTIFLILTIVVSYFFINLNGLQGFCYGAVLLGIIKIGTMWYIGDRVIDRNS